MNEKDKLRIIDGETLVGQPLQPIPFVVGDLLSQGLHILAGAPKVGKSWLALWLAVQVAKGEDVFGAKTKQGITLYLCLEDSRLRIQNRLMTIEDDVPPSVFFSTECKSLGYGLEGQLQDFIDEHPGTVLIIIDTLQKIRKTTYDNTYANDYRDISLLKKVADKNGIAILLIHHLKKEHDDDVMNRISGTTGLSGAADTTLTLVEDRRGSGTAVLSCVGRDTGFRELHLERNEDNIWIAKEDDLIKSEPDDVVVSLVSALIAEKGKFIGTASELVSIIDPEKMTGISERTVKRRILKSVAALEMQGIFVCAKKIDGRKLISIQGVDKADNNSPSPGTENIDLIGPLVPDGTLFSAIKESSPETEGTESPVCDFVEGSGATIPPTEKAAENGEFAERENPGERPGMPLPADENLEVFCDLGRGQA